MKKNLLFLAFALISLTVSAQHTTPAAKVQQHRLLYLLLCILATLVLIRFFILCLVTL